MVRWYPYCVHGRDEPLPSWGANAHHAAEASEEVPVPLTAGRYLPPRRILVDSSEQDVPVRRHEPELRRR